MRIVSISLDENLAGISRHICTGINSLSIPDVSAIDIAFSTNYIQYPNTILYDGLNIDYIWSIVDQADIVLLHEAFPWSKGLKLGVLKRVEARVSPDRTFKLYQAEPIRFGKDFLQIKGKDIVMGPEHFKYKPKAEFLPICIPVEEFNKQYYQGSPFYPRINKQLRISQSATNLIIKSTDLFSTAIGRVNIRRGELIQFVLINNTTHYNCMKIKGSCDIAIDQMLGYYMTSALEGGALKQPVLVGYSKYVREQYDRLGLKPPFDEVSSIGDVEDILSWYLSNPEEISKRGELAYQYVLATHDNKVIAQRLLRMAGIL